MKFSMDDPTWEKYQEELEKLIVYASQMLRTIDVTVTQSGTKTYSCESGNNLKTQQKYVLQIHTHLDAQNVTHSMDTTLEEDVFMHQTFAYQYEARVLRAIAKRKEAEPKLLPALEIVFIKK